MCTSVKSSPIQSLGQESDRKKEEPAVCHLDEFKGQHQIMNFFFLEMCLVAKAWKVKGRRKDFS